MAKLTKRTVDAAKPQERDYFVWDSELPGFGLRIFASGKKSYLVQYRVPGHTRRYTIGLHGKFTPEEARKRASKVLARVADGGDPSAERADARKDMTVGELAKLYLSEGPVEKPNKRRQAGRLTIQISAGISCHSWAGGLSNRSHRPTWPASKPM